MARKATRRTSGSTRKTAVRKDSLDPQEAVELFDQLASEERSASVWSAMTTPVYDEGDRWHSVEENLVRKPSEHESHLRRWKYFAK